MKSTFNKFRDFDIDQSLGSSSHFSSVATWLVCLFLMLLGCSPSTEKIEQPTKYSPLPDAEARLNSSGSIEPSSTNE